MAGRIGFLGGTFDPPHRGHVELARLGRDRLSLERVLLAPTAVQPLKQQYLPGATWLQRLAMVELAIAGEEKLQASTVDAPRDQGHPNYSADTLTRVRELFPEREIYFLLGADAFAGLRRWHDPERLLAQCELAIASRPGYELPSHGNDLLEWMPEGARFLGTEEQAGNRQQAIANSQESQNLVISTGASAGREAEKPAVASAVASQIGPGFSPDKQVGMEEIRQAVASEIGPGFSPDNQGRKKSGALAPGTSSASAFVYLVGPALVRVHLLEDMAEDIAATDLRAQLARGEGFDWLTPTVAEYVRANKLYGT